jgi:hypothetical protein
MEKVINCYTCNRFFDMVKLNYIFNRVFGVEIIHPLKTQNYISMENMNASILKNKEKKHHTKRRQKKVAAVVSGSNLERLYKNAKRDGFHIHEL